MGLNSGLLKVAVIGAGNMAREHIRVFKDIPEVEIAGIFSRTRSKSEALAKEMGIPHVYDSVSSLHQGTQAGLVIVTVTELSMNSVAQACFEHPWTVFLEKPAGYHLEDARDIQKAAQKRAARVYVGLNRRFLSSTQFVLKNLEEQAPGNPRYIRVQDSQSLLEAAKWNHPPEVIKNWMYANSIHLIDYFKLFGRGPIQSVDPIFKWNPRHPGVVGAKISFESGDTGYYEGIWNGPGPWGVNVFTPASRYELRPLEQANFQNAGERQIHQAPAAEWDQKFKPGFRLQAQHAVAAARNQATACPTLTEATDTMELISKIFS